MIISVRPHLKSGLLAILALGLSVMFTVTSCDGPPDEDESDSSSSEDGGDTEGENEEDTGGETTGESTGGETTGDTTGGTASETGVQEWTLPANGRYKVGDEISFTLKFAEAAEVDGGVPVLVVKIGATAAALDNTIEVPYASGSGTTDLVFTYTLAAGDFSPFGFNVESIDLKGASLTVGGAAADTTVTGVPLTTNIKLIEGLKLLDGAWANQDDSAEADCQAWMDSPRFDSDDNGNGLYWIQPGTTTTAIKASCDMESTPNAAWTLVMNYVRPATNTDSATARVSSDLPIIKDGQALGDDHSAMVDADHWGHANDGLLDEMNIKFARFYCEIDRSGTATKMHVRVEEAACDGDAPAGSGGAAACTDGIYSEYTAQGDDDLGGWPASPMADDGAVAAANVGWKLRAGINNGPFQRDLGFAADGDYMATADDVVWLDSNGANWNCGASDDLQQYDTIHQVWVRP